MSNRPSVRRLDVGIFVSGVELERGFFNFLHTHPLGGVDMPFGFFQNFTDLIGRPSAIINFNMPDI